LEEYALAVDQAAQELTRALYKYDVQSDNKHPFSTRPKVHYLSHLSEDIIRFGCALQYETEKGEMYNKFIREQLFHTNRHSPSKDVAARFAKQETLRHIINGGSWLNRRCQRVKYGKTIEEFVNRNGTTFFDKLFGARDLKEPVRDLITGKLKPGFSGVFKRVEDD
ncbi:hypothetical protein BD560DRAFT_326490, partial [Blakeslea trispora]